MAAWTSLLSLAPSRITLLKCTSRIWLRGIEKSPVLDALGLGPVTVGKAAYDSAFANQKPMLTMVDASAAARPALDKVLGSANVR